jgi:hypothetical protein
VKAGQAFQARRGAPTALFTEPPRRPGLDPLADAPSAHLSVPAGHLDSTREQHIFSARSTPGTLPSRQKLGEAGPHELEPDDDTASDHQTYDKIAKDRNVASQSPAEAKGTHSTPTRDPRGTN